MGWSTWSGAQAFSSRRQEKRHKTLGRNNYKNVSHLSKLVKGITLVGSSGPDQSVSCSNEKVKRVPVNKKWSTRAAEEQAILHPDVLGPVQGTAYETFRYAIGFIDSFSLYRDVTNYGEKLSVLTDRSKRQVFCKNLFNCIVFDYFVL